MGRRSILCFLGTSFLLLSNAFIVIQKDRSTLQLSVSKVSAEKQPKKNRKGGKPLVRKPESKPTSRYVAVAALNEPKSTFPLQSLEDLADFRALSTRDRSFARLLVAEAERYRGQLDKVIEHCRDISPKRPSTVDRFVDAVLRVGAVQLLFLSTPPHAAVGETVQVLRMVDVGEPRIRYANAVLRRIARDQATILEASDAKPSDNVAEWLLREWRQAWGEKATSDIVDAALRESPRCLSVRLQPEADIQHQLQTVCDLFPVAQVLPQGSIRIQTPPAGAVSTWPAFESGTWWLQDPSATIPAMALYQILSQGSRNSVENLCVVDLCAAPGGKTAQLCNYGFTVTAVEKSERRSRRLEENLKRLEFDWTTVVVDGTTYVPEQPAAGVLVDVPCTATGTASKRPDVLRRPSDYTELLDIQYRLATHAVESIIGDGGILVYATCSLLKQEGEDQVQKLLNGDPRLETVRFQHGEIPGFDSAIDKNGWIRVLPGSPSLPAELRQSDGFFVARLRRKTG